MKRTFDKPLLQGNQARMEGGWDREAIDAVAVELYYHIPDGTFEMVTGYPATAKNRRAVASASISAVRNALLFDARTHYSRRRCHYSNIPKRYRTTDPFNNYADRTRGADILIAAGLVGAALGEWCWGRESVLWPTDELIELVTSVVDVHALVPAVCQEIIELRKRGHGPSYTRLMAYDDTPETIAYRKRLTRINELAATVPVFLYGKQMPTTRYYRGFCDTFSQGGRLSLRGNSFQNIHAYKRPDLQLLVNGELHPVTECDYANLHAVLAYAEARQKRPIGDLYRIPGILRRHRRHIKLAFNIMLNSPNRLLAIQAIAQQVKDEELIKRSTNGMGYFCPKLHDDSYTHWLITAVEKHHHRIAHLFCTDAGVRFQRIESEMALEVIEEMIAREGYPPLCIHDSFVVKEEHGDLLATVMKKVARGHGLYLRITTKARHHKMTVEDLQPNHPLRSHPPYRTTERSKALAQVIADIRTITTPTTPTITPTTTSATTDTIRYGELSLYAGRRRGVNEGQNIKSLWERPKTRYLGPTDKGRGPPYGEEKPP
jgi:hypothetical protein